MAAGNGRSISSPYQALKMTEREFAADILSRLPFEPNEQQMKVALALAHFCTADDSGGAERVFILNGYAGTGKTSLTGALVKSLRACHVDTVLLAPTGRAAKVFSASAGVQAYTIHRKIYKHMLAGTGQFGGAPAPQENKLRNAVFIVDEASMIANDGGGTSNILTDLIHFVYSSQGCRLILMGDTAQLPPVGQPDSPAMNPDVLRSYGLKVTRVTMTEVARQAAESGILRNATRLRRALTASLSGALPDEKTIIPFSVDGFDDVSSVSGEELPDLLDELYRNDGEEETVVITRSNLSATEFNKGIRAMVMGREEQLSPGDLLIAAKNNYYWSRKVRGLDFIANGEVLRLLRTLATEVRYGLRFATVRLEPLDRPGLEFEAKVILNGLDSNAVALDSESAGRLYQGVYADPEFNAPSASHEQRVRAMRESPYFNALQVKYAYAVTCHKAQGGQWKNVLVDLSYIPPEQIGGEFYRWLYTAVTRARGHLYFINPPEELL